MARQHPRPLAPIVNDQAPFTSSMTQGFQPDTPRLMPPRFAHRAGWSVSQTTHVDAPFTSSMTDGWHADRPRLSFTGPKGGLQLSQTSPVAATFGPEMVIGWHPDRPRLFIYYPQGQQLSQTTHSDAVFTIDMVTGSKPERPRLPFTSKTGWFAFFPQTDEFPPESTFGYHPDRPRLFIYYPQGQQLSQTTHVSAPFSMEMVAGWQPVKPALFNISHIDQSVSPITVIQVPGLTNLILVDGRLAMQISGMIYAFLD